MEKIVIKNLTKEYIDNGRVFRALDNVSLAVQDGEFVSIIGSSGCGKSTLLSIVEGINTATEGAVYIDGKKTEEAGLDRGVVFQQYSLFPWMTARKNVRLGIKQRFADMDKKEQYRIADEFLKKVGLASAKDKYPMQMSGGQRQRVAIARALAMDTDILLMDEPFGAIDTKNRADLQQLLLDLWEGDKDGKRKTILFVTHDIDEAIILSDRIIMMQPDPGHIYREVTVPFVRTRSREKLVGSKEYNRFRNELVSLFYARISENLSDDSEL